MKKEEAINLYQDIKNKYGILTEITIERNKPIIFEANMYEDDDNNLQSCGYNGENKNWKNLEEISKNINVISLINLIPQFFIQNRKKK